MRIAVAEDGDGLEIRDVFSGVTFCMPGGVQIAVCMRDGTLEYHVFGTPYWYSINTETGRSERL